MAKRKAPAAPPAAETKPAIAIGDVVQLKSGGHPMTVIRLIEADEKDPAEASVMWSTQGDLAAGMFPVVALKPFDRNDFSDGIPF